MAWPVSDLWAPAMTASHTVYNSVQVWQGSKMIGWLPFTAGSVKDDWVSGVRRSVTLSMPSDPALKPLIAPGVELRPYSGINYGFGAPEILPLGRFPLFTSSFDIRGTNQISLSCNDRWQFVADCPFPTARAADTTLTIQQQIIQLLIETQQWTAAQITCTVTSTVKVAAQTWASDRSKTILELAGTIGAEVFIDRLGNPVIQPRRPVGTPVASFAGGDGGRLKDLTVNVSTADVYNAVTGTSTSTDPAFPSLTYTARIMDPTNPAYPRPGVPLRTFPYTSPQFAELPQLKAAVQSKLTKLSQSARSLSLVGVVTDASLDASDTITVTDPTTGATETAQVQSVDHALVLAGSDAQQITTVSTRSDADLTS